MKLEICANSYQSAINAEKAGAHRVELCCELSVGGITPSYALIQKVVKTLGIPVFVLIRPRSGNFTYSNIEFEIIKTDIEICKALGVKGIVSGVLDESGHIDINKTKALIELSKPMQFTFHRAFDCVPKPFKALEQLIVLGADRILTSGQKGTAEKGISLLKDLNKEAKGKIIILPGSGINPRNVRQFKAAGFTEIHSSASKKIPTKSIQEYFETQVQTVSSKAIIRQIIKQTKS